MVEVRVREFVDRERDSFWRIELAKPETYARFTTVTGKIGTSGRSAPHGFGGWRSFAAAVRNAINARLRAGYLEVTRVPALTAKQKQDIRLLDSSYEGPAAIGRRR